MAEAKFSTAFPWYQETELSGVPLGEDLTFMLRAGRLGFPVYVDTNVQVGHVKPTMLSAEKWLRQEGVQLRPVEPTTAATSADMPMRTLGNVPSVEDLAAMLRPTKKAVTHVH